MAELRSKRKQDLDEEEAEYVEGVNKKREERLEEEEGLSPATRDVKHFSEAMHDECDMEPCRVRQYTVRNISIYRLRNIAFFKIKIGLWCGARSCASSLYSS